MAVNNLDKGSRIESKLAEHLNTHGVGKMNDLMLNLKDDLEEYEQMDVNVAITGQSGAGKSSLINCLRNIRPKASGSARVGCTETTMLVTPYKHPEMPKVVFWDLPGINTPNFPKASYEKKVGITRFDAIIICTSDRFREDDLWFAQKAYDRKIPFYCVRTKIDHSIDDAKEDYGDEFDEVQLLSSMKSEIQGHMKNAGIPFERVYLISTKIKYQTRWDFDILQKELINNAPTKNRLAFVMSLIANSQQCIDSKHSAFEQRIEGVANQAVENKGNEISIVQIELSRYREGFGLNERNLKNLGVEVKNLQQELQDINEELTKTDTLLKESKDKLEKASGEISDDGPSVHPAYGAIPIAGAIACIIGMALDLKKREAALDAREADIKRANLSLEAAKKMKDGTEAMLEKKRQASVKEHAREILSTSLASYAEIAKGILQERQRALEK